MTLRILSMWLLLATGIAGFSQAPINDNCANAISIAVQSSCVAANFSNENATPENISVAPNPSCGYYAGTDIWFKVIMPTSGAMRIESQQLSGSHPPSITVYRGTCGALTEVSCYFEDRDKTINRVDLAGQTLFIRAYSHNATVGIPFSLCVYEPPIPENDNCANALILSVGNACSVMNTTNEFATAEALTMAPAPSCTYYAGGDVWFKAIMPTSGQLRIEVKTLGARLRHSFTVYSGSCGSLGEVACSNLDADKTISRADLAGTAVYIRVNTFNAEEGMPFSICVFEPVVPANDNCGHAIALNVSSECASATFSNAFATKESVTVSPNPSCPFYLGGDIWFKATMPSSGSLRIEVKNIGSNRSPSLSVYKGTCGSFSEVTCANLDAGVTINRLDLAAQELYIRVYSYYSEEGEPFTICLFEPDVPSNDQCTNAIPLTVETTCTLASYSNVFATSESSTIAPMPSCQHYLGGDVWFKTVVPLTGVLLINLETAGQATPPSLSVYTGTCGAFREVSCFNLNNKPLINNTQLAGKTVYLRVYRLDSKEGSPFSICVYDPGCIPTTVAKNHAMCQGETFIFGGTPLTSAGLYSHTFETFDRCDSLVNLTLTVYPTFTIADTVAVCNGSSHTFPDGVTVDNITTPFAHASRLSTAHYCDSIVNTVVNLVEVDTAVSLNNTTLIAHASAASYQWLACDNNYQEIAGENGTSFSVTENGSYAVKILQNGCENISACHFVTIVGLQEINVHFDVYPNPSHGDISIRLSAELTNATIEMTNMLGQMVAACPLQENQLSYSIDASGLPSGTYILKIELNGKRWIRRKVLLR